MKKFGFLALFAALVAAGYALAKGPDKYIYDPAHTQILFSVNHLGFSHPHGRFDKFKGGFTFDPANPETSSVQITIDANSVDMASADWERMMKGSNFLNAAKYPDIVFKSTKIEKTGENTGRMTGDLTILNVTKPVTLNVVYNKSGVHPLNKNFIAGFSASTKINRSDFGMNWGLPGIGDEIAITIEVEGIRQDFGNLNNK